MFGNKDNKGLLGNIDTIMKLRSAWSQFSAAHPKFTAFLGQLGQNGLPEGTILEIHVEYPDGRHISSNMRVSAEDLALLESIRDLAGKQ